MYQIHPLKISQSARKAVNEKILAAIDSGSSEFTAETVYNSYTGHGGLHTLKQGDFASYSEYAEAKREQEMGQFFTPHEICRTMAMDFWASLEHKIYYKFEGNAPGYISRDLRECSDIVSMLDAKMLQLNEAIIQAKEAQEEQTGAV